MREKPRIAFAVSADGRLEAAFERNLQHAERQERPPRVDVDIWERYVAGRGWVLLNVGIMGLVLERKETSRVLAEASRQFYERGENLWLVAELLRGRGDLDRETAFGFDLAELTAETVDLTVAIQRGVRRVETFPGVHPLSQEAGSLLFCAIANNRDDLNRGWESADQEGFLALLRSIRSADVVVDRRLGSLRAISGRRLDHPSNVASLNSLIWGAIGAATVAEDERDKGYALMGVEPILDPVTLATAMLVIAHSGPRTSKARLLDQLQGRSSKRPRGWDDDVALETGISVYGQYLQVLRESRLG